jgi:hypothetical protein
VPGTVLGHDPKLSARIEIDGVGRAVGRYLDRLADDLGAGRLSERSGGKQSGNAQSDRGAYKNGTLHDPCSLLIRMRPRSSPHTGVLLWWWW